MTKNRKPRSKSQEKNYALWAERMKQAKSLGLEKGRIPKKFSPALKSRLYRAYKKLGKAMIKGGKYAYENVGGNYYKYTSIKVSGHEARLLRDKGQRVYKNRLIVNSSIAYKPTLHRKFKDPLTGIKDLAIVYRETGSGPVTRIGGTNFRVKLIGQGFTLMNFIAAVEQGKLPTDNRINYSIDVGDNMPFKRVFNNPLELLFYLGVEMDYPENFDPNTPPGANVRFPNMQQIERIIPRINISVFSDTRMKPLKSAQR